jgi:hypothetical protein
VHAEGAITRTEDIEAALRHAIAVVKQGKPALIDIFTQNR